MPQFYRSESSGHKTPCLNSWYFTNTHGQYIYGILLYFGNVHGPHILTCCRGIQLICQKFEDAVESAKSAANALKRRFSLGFAHGSL